MRFYAFKKKRKISNANFPMLNFSFRIFKCSGYPHQNKKCTLTDIIECGVDRFPTPKCYLADGIKSQLKI